MIPLPDTVGLGPMAKKGNSEFPKVPALLEPHHQIVNVISGHSLWSKCYLLAKMQSVYSTAQPDWPTETVLNNI